MPARDISRIEVAGWPRRDLIAAPRAAGPSGVEARREPAARRARRWASVLTLVGSMLVLLPGCAVPGGTLPPLPLARDLPADTRLWLPVSAPPDLIDANLSSINDTPVISFYSRNESIVTVCQATRERCLRFLPTAQVIPRPDIVPDVTVLIEAHENGVVPLSESLARYWAEVELVAGRPAWLGAP